MARGTAHRTLRQLASTWRCSLYTSHRDRGNTVAPPVPPQCLPSACLTLLIPSPGAHTHRVDTAVLAPQFPRNRRRLDGRDNRCKRCTARMVAERLKQREPITAPTGAPEAPQHRTYDLRSNTNLSLRAAHAAGITSQHGDRGRLKSRPPDVPAGDTAPCRRLSILSIVSAGHA